MSVSSLQAANFLQGQEDQYPPHTLCNAKRNKSPHAMEANRPGWELGDVFGVVALDNGVAALDNVFAALDDG